MSLPSQNRSFGSRSSRKRRRKGPPKAVFIVPLMILGLVGLWWVMGGGSNTGESTTDANSISDPTNGGSLAATDTTADRLGERDSAPINIPDLINEIDAQQTNQSEEQVPSYTEINDPTQNREEDIAAQDPVYLPANDQPPVDQFQPAAHIADMLEQATGHLNRGELVSARAVLNDALRSDEATDSDRSRIREDLTTVNKELFFGSTVYPGDSLSEIYEIQPGNSLARITRTQGLTVDWRLIQRINRISDPSRIRVGQKIKLVRGPIHAIVTKSDYRVDLYAGPPGSEDQWMFLCSYPVGLGEGNSTPIGEFVVRNNSKLINPVWRNPRTGEHFASDDPKNPIGERWVGIEGVGNSAVHEGYGIHGTIDPESIGTDASMGCIRMNDDAVEIVYEMLVEQISQVIVRH
jgi:hypothetical protein